MMNKNEILDILKKEKVFIYSKYKVQMLGLFGSLSENKHTQNSDIDILVSFQKGNKDLVNFIRLKFYLEDLLNSKVDLVNKDGIKPVIKNKILRQVIYV